MAYMETQRKEVMKIPKFKALLQTDRTKPRKEITVCVGPLGGFYYRTGKSMAKVYVTEVGWAYKTTQHGRRERRTRMRVFERNPKHIPSKLGKPSNWKWFSAPTKRAPRRMRRFWLAVGGPHSTKAKAQTRARSQAKILVKPNFSRVFKNQSGWWVYHADTGSSYQYR